MIGQTVSRYRIFKSLDKGGMGEVYLTSVSKSRQSALPGAIQHAQAAGDQVLVEWIAQERIHLPPELNNSGGKCTQ
jgi:hypothetical protein